MRDRVDKNDHKDSGLYAVSLSGVDNIWPVGSRRQAYAISVQMNLEYSLTVETFDSRNNPIMWASPVEWPYSKTEHAKGVLRLDPCWQNWEVG